MEGKALKIRHMVILDDYNLPYENYLFVKKILKATHLLIKRQERKLI